MAMEELESVARNGVIDLGDEMEEPGSVIRNGEGDEEVYTGPGTAENPIAFWPMFERNTTFVKNKISSATGIDLDDPEVLAAIMDDDIMEFSFADAHSQQADVVHLSSSESGDEEDGDINGEIAEEQEEIVTTLSREDAVVFAEVMKAIREGGDLRKFKVDQLKTYLRHHGLRMSGVKFDLLSRIQEHQRINDPGRAEERYPRASFSINCKGDVCLGDMVLFLQNVYDMPFDYEIRSASGPSLGKRWVAGKVVSESYGAGKQQHTFTIEVLWSRGIKPFYCMRPVKIKGRNLYRMVTMRQPWSNEAERQKVLDEKHARGAAARAHRRAVKGLKSKGKSRADSRVHPYSRAESHGIAPTNGGIHTRSKSHQGTQIAPSVAPLHSGMQHGSRTEQAVYQTFMATNNPEPGRSSTHTQQQGEWQSVKYVSTPVHGHPAQRALAQNHGQKENQGNSNPAHVQPPPRTQHGRTHPQHQTSSQHRLNPKPSNLVPCSNTKCEQAGAMKCITRSCGSCCYKNTTRGRCQRHR